MDMKMLREGVTGPFTAQPSTSNCLVSVEGRKGGALAILGCMGSGQGAWFSGTLSWES